MNAYDTNQRNEATSRIRKCALTLGVLLGTAAPAAAQDCECDGVIILGPGESCTLAHDCEVSWVILYGDAELNTADHELTITGYGGLIMLESTWLKIPRRGRVTLTGGGTFFIAGTIELKNAGPARWSSILEIAANDHTLAGGGLIEGQHADARILVGDNVTFTNQIRIENTLQITEPFGGAANTTFINGTGGLVRANNASGTLEIAVDTLGVSAGNWECSAGSAFLKLNYGSSAGTHSGDVTVSAGTLDVDESFTTTGDLTLTEGAEVNVAANKTFQAG